MEVSVNYTHIKYDDPKVSFELVVANKNWTKIWNHIADNITIDDFIHNLQNNYLNFSSKYKDTVEQNSKDFILMSSKFSSINLACRTFILKEFFSDKAILFNCLAVYLTNMVPDQFLYDTYVLATNIRLHYNELNNLSIDHCFNV